MRRPRTVPRFLLAAPLLGAAALVGSELTAQLREAGTPASFRNLLPLEIPVQVLPAPDLGVLKTAATNPERKPFRYGVELDVGLDLESAGRWDHVDRTDELVWRIELAAPGAFSLGVFFSQFDVPSGAQVFLYDPAHHTVLGAYGRSTENPNGMLAVQPLRGDQVVIEYVEPPGVRSKPKLRIASVTYDYLDILARMARGDAIDASCLVDVNCPQGAEHQDVKRAVVWMFRSGAGCSGSILNNTAEDGTPYLMTAEHCGDMTNAVFVFDYERSGCGSGASSQSKSLSGAARLAVSSVYDGQLYRLNQAPPASYEPFFEGWSLATDVQTGTFGISHPGGDPKKIQIDHQAPFLTDTRWNVQNDVGAVQPGSSGSPLFDGDERAIGTLSTGAGFCGSNFANYGRFDQFYRSKNLGLWLDPLGWNLTGIDGFDPIDPYAQPYRNGSQNPALLSSLNDPRLGTTWSAAVDASSLPAASSTILIGHPVPADSPVLALGTLLVDLGTPRLFQHNALILGGLSTHSFALPPNAGLSGFVAYTQAFVLGGGITATNGLKLVLNF